ncbi:MAG: hypothetical protein IH945_09345 [Armatimonadetes bacterium]|nr:hypothetical protein [Armatimonadota bacterium]
MDQLLTPLAGLDYSALPQQLVVGILTGSIYALIALGYTMVYGVLKLINFAHGEVYMLGAYFGLFISWIVIGDAVGRAGATQIIAPGTLMVAAYVLVAAGVLLSLRPSRRKILAELPRTLVRSFKGLILVLHRSLTGLKNSPRNFMNWAKNVFPNSIPALRRATIYGGIALAILVIFGASGRGYSSEELLASRAKSLEYDSFTRTPWIAVKDGEFPAVAYVYSLPGGGSAVEYFDVLSPTTPRPDTPEVAVRLRRITKRSEIDGLAKRDEIAQIAGSAELIKSWDPRFSKLALAIIVLLGGALLAMLSRRSRLLSKGAEAPIQEESSPDNLKTGGDMAGIAKGGYLWELGLLALGALVWCLALFQPQAITLVFMMLASMVGCAIVGVLIEFFAYRPMRSQPRISILITAIGVSLLIQFTGQLFLPNAPPPKISGDVNPYRDSVSFFLDAPPLEIANSFQLAEKELNEALAEKEIVLEAVGGNEFNLPASTPELVKAREAEAAFSTANALNEDTSVSVTIPKGQLIMFFTTIVLMFILRHLVMKTTIGRGMRAVSHDFEAASLMGVSVNKVIVVTFIIGSSLAGAGAMMSATFLQTPLTSFYGLIPGVKAFVAAVLGGIGNIPGAVLGGLLMGVAEVLMVWVGYSGLKDAMAFVILILVLLFRPGGLMGSATIEKV